MRFRDECLRNVLYIEAVIDISILMLSDQQVLARPYVCDEVVVRHVDEKVNESDEKTKVILLRFQDVVRKDMRYHKDEGTTLPAARVWRAGRGYINSEERNTRP